MTAGPEDVQTLRLLYTRLQETALAVRAVITRITTGIITLLIAMDGWLIGSAGAFSHHQQVLLGGGMLVVTGVGMFAVLARFREFCAVARLIVRTEIALGVYEPGRFIDGETLYPPDYRNLGQKGYRHSESILRTHWLILALFCGFSICICFLS